MEGAPTLIELTTTQLRAELTEAELRALPKAVLASVGDGAAEAVEAWLGGRLLQACDRVVVAVNSCSQNRAIMTGLCKVPAGCVRTALVLARHAVISAIPGMADTLEGGTRSAEYSTATNELRALASCELRPEYALTDDEALTGTGGGFGFIRKPADSFLW